MQLFDLIQALHWKVICFSCGISNSTEQHIYVTSFLLLQTFFSICSGQSLCAQHRSLDQCFQDILNILAIISLSGWEGQSYYSMLIPLVTVIKKCWAGLCIFHTRSSVLMFCIQYIIWIYIIHSIGNNTKTILGDILFIKWYKCLFKFALWAHSSEVKARVWPIFQEQFCLNRRHCTTGFYQILPAVSVVLCLRTSLLPPLAAVSLSSFIYSPVPLVIRTCVHWFNHSTAVFMILACFQCFISPFTALRTVHGDQRQFNEGCVYVWWGLLCVDCSCSFKIVFFFFE